MVNPPTPIVTNHKPKSFVDTKPEDLELFKLRNKINVDECAIRIRHFQPEDAEQVRELFWVGITVGRECLFSVSPCTASTFTVILLAL